MSQNVGKIALTMTRQLVSASISSTTKLCHPRVLRTVSTMHPLTSSSLVQSCRAFSCLPARSIVSETIHCRSVHTEADKELKNFLEEELKYEKESRTKRGPVPDLGGFKIQGNGAEVKLVKNEKGEQVSISFNINNSVDADDAMEMEQSEEPPQMVSRPAFTVEISKDDKAQLVLDCQFTRSEENEAGEQATEQKEVFEIVEAWIQNGELNDSTYVISSDNMDGTLYDILINTLCDRGLDDAFVSQLAEFSTHYEHEEYIKFLEKLQLFSAN